jgi:rare lipoprotein A
MRNYFIFVFCIALLASCAAPPKKKAVTPEKPVAKTEAAAPAKGGYLEGDGPDADIPANLDAIPDAMPRNEPLHRYANYPYVALGKAYTPLTKAGDFTQRGIASWYGKKFHGQRTSSGEAYDMYAMTAAHPTLPIPSYARVTNLANTKSVIVRINDRGPFLHDRVIDLSYVAAHKLGIINNGSAEVEVQSLAPDAVILPVAASAPPAVASAPVTASSVASSDSKIYLQLGAFKTSEAATAYLEKMRNDLSDTDKQFRLSSKDEYTRVQMGPYETLEEARSSAAALEVRLGFKPVVSLP